MLTMQQPTINHHAPLGMNIKSAMAANMGSSLFLFQGLHRISPYLLGAAAASPSKQESTPSPSYFRFELQCTFCRQGECPICLDYSSKIRIGYSSSSQPTSSRRTKKQARECPDEVQLLKLDLCSYSRKVSLAREIINRWIGLSYTEGDARGSKPKEVDFDGLMRELEGNGIGYEIGVKEEEEEWSSQGRPQGRWSSSTGSSYY